MSGRSEGPIEIYRGFFSEAGLVQGYLGAHGIQAVLDNPAVGSTVPHYVTPGGVGPVGVMIDKKNLRRARVLVQSFLKDRVKVTESAAREAQSPIEPTLTPTSPSGSRVVFGAVAVILITLWVSQSGYLRRMLFHAPTQEEIRNAQLESARHATFVIGKAGVEWVKIPGGTFSMGSGRGDEGPIHRVTLKTFEMSRTLVTVAQYKACVDAGACTQPRRPYDSNWGISGRDDHPINDVDWEQARAFSVWVGGRLPSEAEWEYAARSAGKDFEYPWGNDAATCRRAVIFGGGGLFLNGDVGCGTNATWPVCAKPAGNSEQGLCDMVGNTWEWVQDKYHSSYERAPTDGSAWDGPSYIDERVLRGGSWDLGANAARATRRSSNASLSLSISFGFRPVRDAQ